MFPGYFQVSQPTFFGSLLCGNETYNWLAGSNLCLWSSHGWAITRGSPRVMPCHGTPTRLSQLWRSSCHSRLPHSRASSTIEVSCPWLPATHRLHHDLCPSYHKISWNLEAARLEVVMIVSLRNLTGISAALLDLKITEIRIFISLIQFLIWLIRFTDISDSNFWYQ